ncbi:CRISPR-associated RAMP protein Csx10 [Calothrix sp. UHCC 0171]|uniref:type III-D CRISPR-associated RAMP protein Csx10 n=1 Tax=Calothrix sp. UHCC 0171 TaxID=3110245 RepID=UPI002B217B29|nr:CRISPR-associated RAMP protein Csx10 [Calothrix sp. UHCC 0171]MEA5573541.1 CRISPR-associated RAMP protein Csx10 [Calothrix sp. UHCC 0171]
MKKIKLEIKALSPLAISRQKPGGSISECEGYIPGSVIRGAIAGAILQQSNQQLSDLSQNGGDFQTLFLGDNPAIFQNAYPSKGNAILRNQTEKIGVLPATALSSKTKSGFKTDQNNGVFDSLIDRFCAENYGLAYDPTCPEEKGGRVEPFTGFYSKLSNKYHSVSIQKRLLTRVGINRRRATSEEEILYSIEVINESETNPQHEKSVIFKSEIIVADENLSNQLENFIELNRQSFRIGGSTSRGLGKVEIKLNGIAIQEDIDAKIRTKMQILTDRLIKRWEDWSKIYKPIQELDKNRYFFTLNLQSDAILTEKWQRTTVISAKMLKQFTEIEDDLLELEAAYSSYDYRSGWNSAWGLMKDVELVTNKGSVYLFSTTQPDKWYAALAKLELEGVGERTCEGFGQVEICNDFHLVMREESV